MEKSDLEKIKQQLRNGGQVLEEWYRRVEQERKEAAADPGKMKAWIENEKAEFEQAIAIQKKIVHNLKGFLNRPGNEKFREDNLKRLQQAEHILAKMEEEYAAFRQQYV
ncbi:MAG: hypothetical protein HPY81_06655 [Firmicutes bacterium]|nr:hypothetical protein [Bacillota bacterium]